MQGNALLEEALRAHNAGHAQEAARLYQHVLKYDPNDLVALGNLARLFGESGQYAQCEELLHRLTVLAPKHVDAYVNLGTILHEQGKLDAAIEACRSALQLSQ
jgi:tetratricopeptide (TPR) repeat protein